MARHRPHALGKRRRGRDHEIGPLREPALGGVEAVDVDALLGGDVVDAVVDHRLGIEGVEKDLGLRDVPPQHRCAQPQAPRREPNREPEQVAVQHADHRARMERDDQRREDGDAVSLPRRPEPAPQPARDPPQITPRAEVGPAQAERFDEQDATPGRREPRHQMVLVGPDLVVPVVEADADDVAAGERAGQGDH